MCSCSVMHKIFKVFVFFMLVILFNKSIAQTGPGGVGANDGSSSLKLWFRGDNGVSVSGTMINSISNSAGIAALDISESGANRPTLAAGAVNGYNEIVFSGTTMLRSGLTLTTTNFVTNQASSFTVSRAANTTQTSCVYTTDPLVGTTRFSNHIPWSNTIYFDIGTCCSNDARLQVGSLTGLNNYSIWTYDAEPTSGKQLYRDGTLLQDRPNTLAYNSHASHRFNIGGNTSGTNGFVGAVTEIIIFNAKINSAQRIIIDNYLSAKYNISLAANDVYLMDDPANGNYDHEVAGIGRINATNTHTDARGTSIVRISSPSNLGNNEFLMWGHDNGTMTTNNTVDVDGTTIQSRLSRVWRASEFTGDVGTVTIAFDVSGFTTVTGSDLRLIIDRDGDGFFDNDVAPISGAFAANTITFTGVNLQNGDRFTLGSINVSQTPLPVELLLFNAIREGQDVRVRWSTASESNSDHFKVERSVNGTTWTEIAHVHAQGNSVVQQNYFSLDLQPVFGMNYYRLKMVDQDASVNYSIIVPVDFSDAVATAVSVFVNSFNGEGSLISENVPQQMQGIHIYDISGKIVFSHSFESTQLARIPTEQLSAGTYVIIVTSKDKSYSSKFIRY